MNSTLEKKIVVDESLDNHFLRTIANTPEGERILSCLQCGTCSATCPLSGILEYTPRHLFALIRAGQKSTVLSSNTIWICSSCYQCIVDCPAQIKITDIMYRLKRMSMDTRLATRKVDIRRFYHLFEKSVVKYGRSHELGLITRYLLLRHPLQMLKQLPLGIKMILNGYLKIFPHKIRDLTSFRRMAHSALKSKEETP